MIVLPELLFLLLARTEEKAINSVHKKAIKPLLSQPEERRDGLMVSALVSGSSGLRFCLGLGHCVVLLGETLYSNSASFHKGVY